MNFEHLIQINDPLNPLLDTLPPATLWAGLVLRVEQPQRFVPGLDSCTILSRTDHTLERELHYGPATVRDRVTLAPKHQVRYDITATGTYAGGSLIITIEQPDALQLFVRFQYATTLPSAVQRSNDEQMQEIVKSAYREADIDTIRLIREYARDNTLAPYLD